MAGKTRRAKKSRRTRKQRGGIGMRLGFKNNTTIEILLYNKNMRQLYGYDRIRVAPAQRQ
jgi:hypothetical protein